MTDDQIRKALSRAWDLGQTYWRQADSEYASDNRKSDETRQKYLSLVDDTLAAHSAGAEEPEWCERCGYPCKCAQPQPMPQTDAARDQLRHFANAERFSRAVFADDSAFADWVISRSRHVLAEIERLDRAKGE